jgi:predicted MPP superfamily phosphohydrolase
MGTFLFTSIVLACFFYKAYINTRQVIVNHVNISNSRIEEQGQNDLAILHISDMHLENISIEPEYIYETFKDRSLDLVALTGDFLDQKRSIPKLVPYLEALNKLNPKYGIYAVFGNHDYLLQHEDFLSLKRVMDEHGCKTLQNEHVSLIVKGKRINIIGIDDFCTKRSKISESFAGVKDGYNLVLTHDPNIVLEMDGYDYDYLLSGHFHGGQIHWPKPFHLASMGDLVKLQMVKGLHHYKGKPFYISEGLGQTLFNIRLGSRPELTVHQLNLSSIVDSRKTLTAV